MTPDRGTWYGDSHYENTLEDIIPYGEFLDVDAQYENTLEGKLTP
jgi:hypothetical protein